MKVSIATWVGAGFLAAYSWFVYATTTPVDRFLMRLREPVMQVLLYVSCPIAPAPQAYPIRLWWVLLANAATYAAVGLLVELFGWQYRHKLAS